MSLDGGLLELDEFFDNLATCAVKASTLAVSKVILESISRIKAIVAALPESYTRPAVVSFMGMLASSVRDRTDRVSRSEKKLVYAKQKI